MLILGCNTEGLNRLASAIKVGGKGIFPTEASYVMAGVKDGEFTIFSDKERALSSLSNEPIAIALARKFWPGPLALKVRTADGFLTMTVTSDQRAKRLVKTLGGQLNVHLTGVPTLKEAIQKLGRVDVALDCGPVPFPEGYTTIKVEGYAIRVISKGAIPLEMLERVAEEVVK